MSTENLFTPSAIKLFGREFKGLSVNQPLQDEDPPLGEPRIPGDDVQNTLKYQQHPGRLERALRKVDPTASKRENYARFARIYAFAYEGQYYELPRPILFLVRGPGEAPEGTSTFTVQKVGVAAKDWRFASDIKMWEADDKDMSMCIDIESGTMKEILLQPVLETEEEMAPLRGAAASRGAAAGRGAAVARGAAITRDPHRNR